MAEQKTRSPLRWAMDQAEQFGRRHSIGINRYMDNPSPIPGDPLQTTMRAMRGAQAIRDLPASEYGRGYYSDPSYLPYDVWEGVQRQKQAARQTRREMAERAGAYQKRAKGRERSR
jgi:hypothetical protein